MAMGTAVRGAVVGGGAVGGAVGGGSVTTGAAVAVGDGVAAVLVAAAGEVAPPVPDTAAVAPHPASTISEIVGNSRRVTPASIFILHTLSTCRERQAGRVAGRNDRMS
jgi:hypothetical protein